MRLHELSPTKGSTKRSFRVGRGHGSGSGKTAGRGHKGLKARSGSHGGTRPGFEGGQMPLQRRIRKRGFVNIFATVYACVNIEDLNRFENGAVVNFESLKDIGLVKKPLDGVKILGKGDLNKKLSVQVARYSESAKAKIELAGGKAEVI